MPRLTRARTTKPGFTRVRRGRGFSYRDEAGNLVAKGEDLDRVKALAVPPAWTDVWIAPRANDHIQATGIDAAGRLQYIYHPAWRDRMDAAKFDRMLGLAKALPAARRAVTRELAQDGFERPRVLAGAFRLLDSGSVRPGADSYTDQHGSYGLTTLRGSHATVHGGSVVELRFPGKSGHRWHLELDDEALAALVAGLKSRGQRARLFAWRDEAGDWRPITPDQVNAYVRERTGAEFSAKDFRTLAGTAAAALSLARAGKTTGEAARRRAVSAAMQEAAQVLGNTPAIARKSYVDPRIVDAFARGETVNATSGRAIESELLALLTG